MTESNQTIVVPHIEDNIPIPKNAREALPELTPDEELKVRANTIKVISDIKGEIIEPNDDEMIEANKIASKMMSDPSLKPDYANYPNEIKIAIKNIEIINKKINQHEKQNQ